MQKENQKFHSWRTESKWTRETAIRQRIVNIF